MNRGAVRLTQGGVESKTRLMMDANPTSRYRHPIVKRPARTLREGLRKVFDTNKGGLLPEVQPGP
eukprot:10861285-Lingulodinium_polyedra.AAC.1